MTAPSTGLTCFNGSTTATAAFAPTTMTGTKRASRTRRVCVGTGINTLNATSSSAFHEYHERNVVSNVDSNTRTSDFEQLKPDEIEPNLYQLPDALYPVYRSMPFLTKACIGALSSIISVRWHMQSLGMAVSTGIFKKLFKFMLKFVTVSLISTLIVQETYFFPSRINTSELIERQWLPSPLSKFSMVTTKIAPILLQNNNSMNKEPLNVGPIGLHYLEYSSSQNHTEMKFDAIHFNHGFGASSLSWLPAIPSLVDRLSARAAIAHDAPGFGFTDRSRTFGKKNSLVPYTSAGSAALGNTLLLSNIDYMSQPGTNSDELSLSSVEEVEDVAITTKRVALFGHSMGCAATLRMALSLPRDINLVVILVAPALFGSVPVPSLDRSLCKDSVSEKVKKSVVGIIERQPEIIRTWFCVFVSILRNVVFDSPLMFVLKRLVARPNFWLKGLRLAWGNPEIVTESDALRFEWPSISRGWERGLLAFTRSRILSICSYVGGEQKLLDDVVQLPNTSVIICHGTNDPVIPVSMSRQIAERWKSAVSYIELEGQGHDPFEEGIEEFVSRVVQSIEK